jgi:hypothetical protein
LSIVGVTDEAATKIKPFIKSKGINYLIAIGRSTGYQARGIPASWLIDTKGNIVWEGHPAGLKDQQIEELVKAYTPWPQLELGGDLKKASAYVKAGRLGDGIKALTRFLKKPSDDSLIADAEKGLKSIEEFGASQLAGAEEAVKKGDFDVVLTSLELIEKSFKGHDVGDQAKARLRALKKEKATKNEMAAAAIFIKAQKNIDSGQNRFAMAYLRQITKAKKYADTKMKAKAEKLYEDVSTRP